MTPNLPEAEISAQCPACRSRATAEILYGIPAPSQQLESALANGDVVLGGCNVSENSPERRCTTCGFEWASSRPNFSSFKMTETQAGSLHSQFHLLMERTDLTRCSAIGDLIARHRNVSGIYFWVMRQGDSMFRIYIGKSKSLSARIENYICQFQPHSPNDYKLRVFWEYMADNLPEASLSLYFAAVPPPELTEAENAAVRHFDPLLNKRQTASPESRAALRAAFTQYYRFAFCRTLLGGS